MNQYTTREMAQMHFVYGEAHGNAVEAQRIYAQRFPHRNVPNSRTFTSLHRRLMETGSFRISRPDAGRPRSLNHEDEENILDYFDENPNASVRSERPRSSTP